MRPLNSIHSAAGFSMVEVLVALVVLSVGLLGIAKMQALGLSSNAVAGKRALAAIQADSIAAAMHENRAFWTSAAAVTTWTASTTVVPPSCAQGGAAAPCTPTALAAYDLYVWAQNLNLLLLNANSVGTVICAATVPVTCQVTITWTEKTLAINTQGQAAAQAVAGTNLPSYTLFVEP
jgi:type IV pilus assembly protein PilV